MDLAGSHVAFAVAFSGALVLAGIPLAAGLPWPLDDRDNYHQPAVIRPGAYLGFEGTGCSLGVILEDPRGRYYGLSAGHCAEEGGAGSDVKLMHTPAGNPHIGTVEAFHWDNDGWHDWALIAFDADDRRNGNITPSIRNWTGPTGVLTGPETDYYDDRICWYGNNIPQNLRGLRRRCGHFKHLTDHGDSQGWWVTGHSGSGDSGGPVIHYETGRALGVVSSGLPGTLVLGQTLCSAFTDLQERGYDMRLATADYDPPFPVPTGVPLSAARTPQEEPDRMCP